MHFRPALLALHHRAVIALDAEFALFNLVAVAGRVITTDVQLTLRIDKVAVHRRPTLLAATFGAQRVGFRVIAFQHVEDFVLRHQVDGGFAPLFRRQGIARTAEENAGAGGTDPHFTAAGRAVDAGEHHRVRLHAALFRIFLCRRQLGGKIAEEVVQHLFPLGLVVRNLVEAILHLRGKIVVHQIAEVFFQPVGNDLAHFFGVKTTIFHPHVAAILNGRNDRRVGRRTANPAFFQLFHQRGLAETRRRLGKVLRRRQLHQAQAVALFDQRQRSVFIALAQRRHDFCPAVET